MTAPISVAFAVILLIFCCLYLPPVPLPYAAIGGFFLVALLIRLSRRSAVLMVLLVGMIVNTDIRLEHWQSRLISPQCEQRPLVVKGYLVGLPQKAQRGYSNAPQHKVILNLASVTPQSCSGPKYLQLYVQNLTEEQLYPGNWLQLDVVAKRPWRPINPHALNGERDYLLRGIHAVGSGQPSESLLNTTATENDASPIANTMTVRLRALIDRRRMRLSNWIHDSLDEPSNRFVPALVVGDRRFLQSGDRDLLQRYGLSHLFVVSGLHISIAALVGWTLGAVVARSLDVVESIHTFARSWAQIPALFSLGMSLTYTLFAGASVPTQRAFLMLFFALLPRILGRSTSGPDALAVACIVVLCIDPLAVLSPSFWLSFAAVAFLLWLGKWRKQFSLSMLEAARIQALILLFMIPMGWFWFGSASTLGAVLNFVAIPFMCFFLLPAMACALMLALVVPELAASLLNIVVIPVNILFGILADWGAAFSNFVRVERGLPIAPALSLFLAISLVRIANLFRLYFAIAALSVATFIPSAAPLFTNNNDNLKVLFFDVGQGTAVLLEHAGERLLYDTGGGAPGGTPIAVYTVLPYLRREAAGRLNWLVVSHDDLDHAGGVPAIREAAEILSIRDSQGNFDAEDICRMGEAFRLGSAVRLQFLNTQLRGGSSNANSCVLKISAYGQTVMLAGDIDSHREHTLSSYWGQDLRADILLVSHHGSGSSSTPLWLKLVDPRLAIVTAGRKNRFGHPNPRVVDRLATIDTALMNTADVGAIELNIRPDGSYSCRVFRHRWAPVWRRGLQARECRVPRRSA